MFCSTCTWYESIIRLNRAGYVFGWSIVGGYVALCGVPTPLVFETGALCLPNHTLRVGPAVDG
jgi:hypothetical protein